MSEHICNPTIPVCSCGHRWEFKSKWRNRDGTTHVTYNDADCRHRYIALYGTKDLGPNHMIPVDQEFTS